MLTAETNNADNYACSNPKTAKRDVDNKVLPKIIVDDNSFYFSEI